jgi:hypothetical protein
MDDEPKRQEIMPLVPQAEPEQAETETPPKIDTPEKKSPTQGED